MQTSGAMRREIAKPYSVVSTIRRNRALRTRDPYPRGSSD